MEALKQHAFQEVEEEGGIITGSIDMEICLKRGFINSVEELQCICGNGGVTLPTELIAIGTG